MRFIIKFILRTNRSFNRKIVCHIYIYTHTHRHTTNWNKFHVFCIHRIDPFPCSPAVVSLSTYIHTFSRVILSFAWRVFH